MLAIGKYVLAFCMTLYLIMESDILNAPRRRLLQNDFFRALLNCPICSGVWASAFIILAPSKLVSILALAGANMLFWKLKYGD